MSYAIDFDGYLYSINGSNTALLGENGAIRPEVIDTGVIVNHNPIGMTANPLTNKLYVIYQESNEIDVIDSINDKIISKISLNNTISEIKIDEERNLIYATNGNLLSIIDVRTNKVISHVDTGLDYATKINLDLVDNFIFVGSVLDDKIVIIDGGARTIYDNITSSSIDEFAYNSNNEVLYIVDRENDIVYEDDMTKNVTIEDSIVSDIAINTVNDLVYLIHNDSHTLSTIDFYSKTVINNLTIPGFLSEVEINPITNTIYVIDEYSNSVLVIDGEQYKIIKKIPLGNGPTDLDVDSVNNLLYIVNRDSDTLSVIDGKSNELLIGLKVNLSQPNSGKINCGGTELPINQYIKLKYATFCNAEPNEGFRFTGWKQDSGNNSSRSISMSTSTTFFDVLLKWLGYDYDNSTKVDLKEYGTFTADFVKVNSPIPTEYWIPLYGIIVSTIVGMSIPSIMGWIRSKADIRKLNHYHQRIKALYSDGKLDEKDISNLDELKRDITDAYSKGKINEKHYENLKTDVSILYDKIYRKSIESLKQATDGNLPEQVDKLKDEIENAHSEGKITELQFNLLNKKLQEITGDDYKK